MAKKTFNNSIFTIYLLLAVVILIWSLNFSVIKISLAYISPIWLVAIRQIIATLFIFVFLALIRKLKLPKVQDIPLILSIGLLQIAIYLILLTEALQYVDVGRSAILSYTTPLWVTPIAVVFFKESLRPLKSIGLLIGFLGVLVLFNPFSFNWHDSRTVIGNGMLLLAAFIWALTMVHARFGKWHSPPITLIPWQLLAAAILCTIIAVYQQPHLQVTWNKPLIYCLLYTAILASAFAYWGLMVASKVLPVVTTSLCLLIVPALALLLSALILDEKLTLNKMTAISLIIIGLGMVIIADNRKKLKKELTTETI